MKTKLSWLLPGGVALMIGLALAWQRAQMGPLQAELEGLRDRQKEIARLRAERERLAAAQVPEPELQRLRSDRAAIGRLREEVEGLRRRTEERSRPAVGKTPERFSVGVEMPASGWRNAGGATPAAALETALWAAAGGDVETFAQRLMFDQKAQAAARELLEGLPATMRAQFATPEQLMAFLSIKDVPTGAAKVRRWSEPNESYRHVMLQLIPSAGDPREVDLLLWRSNNEWKLGVTEDAVGKYAAALRGVPPVATGVK